MAQILLYAFLLIITAAWPRPASAQQADTNKAPDKAPKVAAKIDPAVAEELKYADGSNALGRSYYANIVLDRIRRPDGGRKGVIEVKALANFKKFDEAIAMIAKQPDQDSQPVWAMKLYLGGRLLQLGHVHERPDHLRGLLQEVP